MKRYTIRADSGVSNTGANIFESSTGYWVSYTDHEAALAEAVAKERESIASEMDCACGCRDAVLDMMRTHGRRLARHRCTFSTQCCAIEAAEIRARGDK